MGTRISQLRSPACWLGLLFASCSAAATLSVQVPILGFVGISPAEIRPVRGFVGANVIEEPIPIADSIRAAFPVPGQNYALVVTVGPDSRIGIAPLGRSGLGSLTIIPEGITEFDQVVFSPSGRAVILSSAGSTRIQLITGLPGNPKISRNSYAPLGTDPICQLAVSDDGELLLAGSCSSEGVATVMLIRRDGSPVPLWRGMSISSLRFSPESHAAILADRDASEVILLSGDSNPEAQLTPRVLAGLAQGVNGPSDIEASVDGSRLFVANTGSRNLLIIDRATAEVRVLECGYAPVSFKRLFQTTIGITASDADSIFLVDTAAAAPWAAFAPRSPR